MVPLHTQLSRGPADAFLPGHLDGSCPQFIRDRGFSFSLLSPFFEAGFGLFETDGRSFATRHNLPSPPEARRQIDLTSYEEQNSCRPTGRTRTSGGSNTAVSTAITKSVAWRDQFSIRHGEYVPHARRLSAAHFVDLSLWQSLQ